MRTFGVTVVCVAALIGCSMACTSGNDFDYLALVQQWPPSNGGNNNTVWTLHGVWPSTGSDGPCECTHQQFDESEVQSILPELNAYWPSYDGANSDFWSHEWTKHGTCAEQLSFMDSELKFFSVALQLVEKYNLYPMLVQGGVTPSNDKSYPAGTIGSAIYNGFGQYGSFACRDDKLTSVSLCLDKTLSPTSCPSSQTESDSCGSDIKIPSSPN